MHTDDLQGDVIEFDSKNIFCIRSGLTSGGITVLTHTCGMDLNLFNILFEEVDEVIEFKGELGSSVLKTNLRLSSHQ